MTTKWYWAHILHPDGTFQKEFDDLHKAVAYCESYPEMKAFKIVEQETNTPVIDATDYDAKLFKWNLNWSESFLSKKDTLTPSQKPMPTQDEKVKTLEAEIVELKEDITHLQSLLKIEAITNDYVHQLKRIIGHYHPYFSADQYADVKRLADSLVGLDPAEYFKNEAMKKASAPTSAAEPYTATIEFSALDVTTLEGVVKSGKFLILDTETTGLGSDAEICQIAIINENGDHLLNTLVKPKRPIPADATRIHGISNEMVANAPTYPEVHDIIKYLLTNNQVIVYNATFDRGMLHKSAEAWGLPKTDWKKIASWHCAMLEFAPIYGEWNDYRGSYKWQSLSTAASHYKVTVKNAHSALGDCLMTLAVVKAMYPKDGE